jgi:hypothetical protein
MDKAALVLQISIDGYLLEAMERVWRGMINESSPPDEEVMELDRELIIAIFDDELTEMLGAILFQASSSKHGEMRKEADYPHKHYECVEVVK